MASAGSNGGSARGLRRRLGAGGRGAPGGSVCAGLCKGPGGLGGGWLRARGASHIVRRAGQLSRVRAVFLRGCAGLARLGEGERGDAVRNRRR